MSVDPLAEKYPGYNPYAYTFNNPINFIDPTGMEGEDWYMSNETKKVTWIDGSKNVKGYTHLGYSYSDQSYGENGTDHLVMDGETRKITVNGNTIADFNKQGKITQDGVAVWGNGADPMSGAIGSDRGLGSAEFGDSDVNPFYAVLNEVMAYIGEFFIGDKVREANTSKESTLPTNSKPEMEIIPLYDYKVAPPLGPRGSAAGATVQSRHVKDTMVEKGSSSSVLNRQQRIKSQKQHQADSINRSIRK